MLQRKTTLAIILALSLALAACGGSAEEANGDEVPETPVPTQVASDTPEVEPTPAENASPEAVSGDPIDVAEHIREKTMQLWEVYNTHDIDALKAFYEETYWMENEEDIRSNMQPFKTFNITITGEETSPPTEISPGKWEIKHTGRFPLGSVNMVFIYEEFGGQWLLTYAEDE